VCENIRVMPIFVGGSLDGEHEMKVESKIAIFASCGRYIFRNFIYQTKIIMIVVSQRLVIDIETDDIE